MNAPHERSHLLDSGRVYVSKGWGFEDWIVNTADYCGKVLFVKKGKKCSWHYHKVKDETFYLQSGRVLVRFLGRHEYEALRGMDLFEHEVYDRAEQVVLEPGDSFRVTVGMVHQFEALQDSFLFEFSTHHEDADSIRIFEGG